MDWQTPPPDDSPDPGSGDPSDELPEVSTIHLRRPPFWSFGPILMAVMGGMLLMRGLTDTITRVQEGSGLLEAAGAQIEALVVAAIAGFFLLFRRFVRSRPLDPIRFFADYVEVPVSVNGATSRRVQYRDILSVHLGGYPPRLRLLLESRRFVFHFDQMSFRDPSGPEVAFLELRRRIMRLPEGQQVIDAMQARQQIVGQAMSQRPWATQILLGLLFVIYLNQRLTGAADSFDLLSWGANVGILVERGEYYRLIAANFLHVWNLHFIINGIALYSLGNVMERLLGWERFTLVFLLSGLGATVASTLVFDTAISAGASGCVFGIFGGLAVVNLRYWTRLPLGFRQSKRWWAVIIGINALLPILLPVIDVAGHAGGFVAGGIITFLVLDRDGEIHLSPPAGPLLRTLALATMGLFAVGLGTAIWKVKTYDDRTRYEHALILAQAVAQEEDALPARQNELAWTLAITPESDDEALAIAEQLARSAAAGAGEARGLLMRLFFWSGAPKEYLWQQAMMINDTLATVLYRQGRVNEAAELQRRYIEAAPENLQPGPTLFSQLERFLAARLDQRQATYEVSLDQLRIKIVRADGARPQLALTAQDVPPEGMTLYALVLNGDHSMGLLRILLDGTAAPPTGRVHRYIPGSELVLSDRVQIIIADTRRGLPKHEDLKPDEQARWSWHPTDETVRSYP